MLRRLRASIGNAAGRLRGNRAAGGPTRTTRRAASSGAGRSSGT